MSLTDQCGAAAVPVLAQQRWLTRIDAPPEWRCVDLISDLHLSTATPRTSAAWVSYMRATPADAILLLGDIFEAWVGDDILEGPGPGLERDAFSLLRELGTGCWLGFMPGNRDFLLGDQALQLGAVHGLSDPCVLSIFGQHILLSHGDEHCLDDLDYQRFRLQVRDPAWQSQVLARPLHERRMLAQQLRSASEQHKSEHGPEGYADLDPVRVSELLTQHQSTLLIHGHTHRPATHTLLDGRLRYVLSDWDLDAPAATQRAQVLRLTPEGLQRINLVPEDSAALDQKT